MATVETATIIRKNRSSSLFRACFALPVRTKKYTAKFTENSSMKTVMMISTAGLPKEPTDAFILEKPPVPAVDMAWVTASYQFIPAKRSSSTSTAVSAR